MRALSHYWRLTRADHLVGQALLERRLRSIPNKGRRWRAATCSRPTWGWTVEQPFRCAPNRPRRCRGAYSAGGSSPIFTLPPAAVEAEPVVEVEIEGAAS